MPADAIGGERDLWRLWAARRLPIELYTREGQRLRVLFPGLANNGAGPDFTGALLAFDGGIARRGDVELHLKASSWTGHGHHQDARYNGVILHVVLLDDGGQARTNADAVVPVLTLGPLLAAPRGVETADDQAGPCRRADAPRPEVERVHAILRAAGQERFAARAQRWEGEFAARTSEDCVLEGLLRAVGLGRNAEACLALASALDGTTLEALLDGAGEQRRTVATAVLLGMAGLLEEARADDETRHAWALYRDHWPGRPLNARQWQRFRLRPAHLPEARLRATAILLATRGLRGFLDGIVVTVEGQPPPSPATLHAALSANGAPTGRSWALEAWTNVLLPLLAGFGHATRRAAMSDAAAALYASLPGGGANHMLEEMTTIAGPTTAPRSAVEQQGLLQLWSRHCGKQACEGCPLASR